MRIMKFIFESLEQQLNSVRFTKADQTICGMAKPAGIMYNGAG